MNLLKFPLLQPTPERMYKRKKRLLEDKEEFELWEKKRRQYLDLVGLSKNAVLKGIYFKFQYRIILIILILLNIGSFLKKILLQLKRIISYFLLDATSLSLAIINN